MNLKKKKKKKKKYGRYSKNIWINTTGIYHVHNQSYIKN